MLRYAKKRRADKDVSLLIRRNKQELISINHETSLPLASTVKIILVIEFARQVSIGKIDENERVPKEELLKFYLEKTDGGAHEEWMKEFTKEDYSLKEIAIGMAAYSSNANTDFLLNYLGIEEVNQLLESLNLHHHSRIYPLVSSLYISNYVKFNEKITTKKELLYRMKNMPIEEYIQYSLLIHNHMANEGKKEYMEKLNLHFDLQKIWSDLLPSGSAKDYASLMEMINDGNVFEEKMQSCIEEILGYSIFKNEKNREWIVRGGMKGGSTLFVYTYASYITDKDGNQTEIIFLSNNLNVLTLRKLQTNFNQFVLKVLTNGEYRKKISSE
ncbi:serine hydrolase [Jeotgalibacillus sp. ET6]|uniref:serine hydrolase n=1 Tax=Jeotgalibacillus sp. ET6 TaxID=3037260 RepID=UPI002418524E|nr:serine hydrolase [Jeotgalibacillus sp. ET6]MDG5472142.1 serine hydrolase [Jeotgalibacillus sp. ET6]